MTSYTRINIRINPQNPGVVVNTNDLTSTEQQKKNSLYGVQVPEKDKSQRRTRKNSQQKRQNQTTSTKPNKTRYEPSVAEIAEAEKQRDAYIRQMKNDKATTGMVYTSTQLLKQQNELIHENQKIMHHLIKQNKKDSNNTNSKNTRTEKEKEQMRQATESVNNEIDEIRKIRDQIVRAGKQISENLQSIRSGKAQLPHNLTEMNQHLKTKVDNSIKNIDLLSPQKFDLVNRFQNFNIDAYTQKLNELKKEINNMQKESENVERQLKVRVNNLQKIRTEPQFETQLLQPYQKDIKKRLGAIDLEEAKKRVYQRLGQFDYFKFGSEVTDIGIEIQQELDSFDFICKQYQVHVPILKFDNKQIKSLELKLPSILEEYKQSHGIVFKKQDTLGKNKFAAAKQKQILASSKGEITQAKKNQVQSIPSKPKDLSNEIPYKKVGGNGFKTIMQKKPLPYIKQKKAVEYNKRDPDSSSPQRKGGNKEQEDFNAYLQNIKNEELQILYKERRDQLRRMKQQLYDESTEPLEAYTKISYPKRQDSSIQIDLRANTSPKKSPEIHNKIQPNIRINQNSYSEEDSIGSQIFNPNEVQIKQIGKEVLREKLRDLMGKQKRPSASLEQEQNNHRQFAPHHRQPQMGSQSINAFAEGFLTVINNTFAEMNKGISSSLEKRRPLPRAQQTQLQQPRQRMRIPFPELEDIPKPPKFNLQFEPVVRRPVAAQPAFRYPVPNFPTFSQNFPTVQIPIQPSEYSYYESNSIEPYSPMVDDNSLIKSKISNVPSDNSFVG